MAGIALNRQALELSDSLALVTVRAIQARMATHKREAVVMLFRPLGDEAPTLYGVTLFTARTHLPAMNVGVTIGAVGSHVREHWLGMALGTRNPLVLAAQRILG
jgi:hypothetical protein